MKRIVGKIVTEDLLVWTDLGEWLRDPDEGIALFVPFDTETDREEALKLLAECIKLSDTKWLKPIGAPTGKWRISLKNMRDFFKSLKDDDWLKGWIEQVPDYEVEELHGENGLGQRRHVVRFTLKPLEIAVLKDTVGQRELAPYLVQFRLDHPDPNTSAFMMTDVESTERQRVIVDVIRKTLGLYEIHGLLAGDRNYPELLTQETSYTELVTEHKRYAELDEKLREEIAQMVEEKTEEELFFENICTYMQGCGLGVAVFDEVDSSRYNLGVPFQAGFMMANRKPVCLLKPKHLVVPALGLLGNPYVEYDPEDPERSVPQALENWLDENDLIG